MQSWRWRPGWTGTARMGLRRRWRWRAFGLPVALGLVALLSSCTQYHGPLTNFGDVDQYPPSLWNADPARSQVAINTGIYSMPNDHLILVHVQIPDTNLTSLGPSAVRGAVGVWWIALDDRVPGGGGALAWLPNCGVFKSSGNGAVYDLAGDYLSGPASANLSRYPLAFDPDDGSVSVALSPQDEIAIPRSSTSGPAPYFAPKTQSCPAG